MTQSILGRISYLYDLADIAEDHGHFDLADSYLHEARELEYMLETERE